MLLLLAVVFMLAGAGGVQAQACATETEVTPSSSSVVDPYTFRFYFDNGVFPQNDDNALDGFSVTVDGESIPIDHFDNNFASFANSFQFGLGANHTPFGWASVIKLSYDSCSENLVTSSSSSTLLKRWTDYTITHNLTHTMLGVRIYTEDHATNGDNQVFAASEEVFVDVTFSKPVTVNTTGGTPRIPIKLHYDDGTTADLFAHYQSGSGTRTLTFSHTTTKAGKGIIVRNSVQKNGGGMTTDIGGATTNVPLGNDRCAYYLRAGAKPSANKPPPKVSDAYIGDGWQFYDLCFYDPSPVLMDATVNQNTLTLTFDETLRADVTLDRTDYLIIDSSDPTGYFASGASISGNTVVLTLPRSISSGEAVTLDYYPDIRASAIRDGNHNHAEYFPDKWAVSSTAAKANTSSGEKDFFTGEIAVRNITPPDEQATVTNVEIASNPGDDDTYTAGDEIEVRLTFSEDVTVTGTPQLKIKMDPSYGVKTVDYDSGSGSDELTFVHEVVEPNISTRGIAVLANSLRLNGGSIHVNDVSVDLDHDGLGHDAGHKVEWNQGAAPAEPAESPTVSRVYISSSAGEDDTYQLGDEIFINVKFSEDITVTGRPFIKIDMDPAHWGEKTAYYVVTMADEAAFMHTVVEPNISTQGIAVLANSLELNGGSIRTSDGRNAVLDHQGLGHDPKHKVDWTNGNGAGKVVALDNYPNPFNPETTIRYTLPEASHVQLTVYNLAGQVVRRLVNEYQSAGQHHAVWDSKGLSAGAYLYRLQMGERDVVRKMTLIK